MEVVNYYKETVKMLWRSLKYAEDGEADPADIRRWIQLSSEAVLKIQELITSSEVNFHKKRSLQTQSGLLITIRERLRAQLKRRRNDDDDDVVVLEVKKKKRSEEQPITIGDTQLNTITIEDSQHMSIEDNIEDYIALLQNSQVIGGSVQNSQPIDVSNEDALLNNSEVIGSSNQEEVVSWSDTDSAFQNNIRCGVINNMKHLDLAAFMKSAQDLFKSKIQEVLEQMNSVKVDVTLAAEFSIIKDDVEISETKFFNTKSVAIYLTSDLDNWFQEHVSDPIMRDIEEFQERDSGWTLRSISNLTVNIMKHNPLRAGNQKEKHIKLPPFLRNKAACINVKNDDDQCFKWAVYSAMYPCENGHKCGVASYKKYDSIEYKKDNVYTKLKFVGIDFPTPPRQIVKFERLNRDREISINLYMLKKNGEIYTVVPCIITSEKMKNHINLLVIQDKYIDENDDNPVLEEPPRLHYVWIKNMSALLMKQMNKHKGKIYFCERCLHYFDCQENLKAHEADCTQMNKCKVNMPKKDEKIEFKHFANREKVPIVVYADFECVLTPVEEQRAYQEHEPISIGFFTQYSHDPAKSKYYNYRKERETDENPAVWFVRELRFLAYQLEALHCDPAPMTDVDEESFKKATTCHICGKPFKFGETKVQDHCHISGRYRGAAHNSCNINYHESWAIPVVFHNLSGYDSHLFIRELANEKEFPGRVTLIPKNKERYIAFTKYVEGTRVRLQFIDSFQFLPSSLDKLSSYLSELGIMENVFRQEHTQEQIELLKRKGVFPYDYIASLEKLEDTTLPAKESFYSKLTDTDISAEDYVHAQTVWKTFNIQTLGEYSDLYLKTDVLHLTNVFEDFRKNSLNV